MLLPHGYATIGTIVILETVITNASPVARLLLNNFCTFSFLPPDFYSLFVVFTNIFILPQVFLFVM